MFVLLFFATGTAVAGPMQARIKLNSGGYMPLLNLGGTSEAVKAGDHYSNYTEFLRQGGRGLDTALTYTDPVNIQIRDAIKAHPEIDRTELFVTTKVPCCPGIGYCQVGEYNGSIVEDMQKNNELLQLEAADLTLLHHPCDTAEHSIQRWLDMEKALAQGLTKAIGVSNFGAELLQQLISDKRTTIVPAANQCNHAIGNHNASHNPKVGGDDGTVQFCKEHGISYSAYSPLEGLSGQDIFKIPEVIAIGKAHNVSAAQVALKWIVQQNITAVTAASNPAYIAEDISLWGFELTAEEMASLAAL